MNTDIVRITIIVIDLLVLALTGYAWWDWYHRPERYGRPPRTNHTDTRQPVRHWTARWIRR